MNSLCVPVGRLFITTIKSHSAVINQRFKGTYMYSTHIEKHYNQPAAVEKLVGRSYAQFKQSQDHIHTQLVVNIKLVLMLTILFS